jgi:hypothetical protein
MRGKANGAGLIVGALMVGSSGGSLWAKDALPAGDTTARALAARRELAKCMLQHMVADRTLSYNAANRLCLAQRRSGGAAVVDQTPSNQTPSDQTPATIRKSRTAPSSKADSAA